jgi:tetratricopeptide (TPR) repeat protein
LPDGRIILSKGTLDLTYRDVRRGDDRLAFVLAHEIAHQLNDEFCHMKFFQAIEASRSGHALQGGVLDEVRGIAGLTEKVLAKELQADEHGIAYAAMAGFHTEALVNEDEGVNFFEESLQAMDPGHIPGVHSDSSHTSPPQRTAAVKARLRQILATVDMFALGVRLYQAGDYHRAIIALEEVLRFFPSREACHNLAASHHQLALKYSRLWERDDPVLGYKVSLTIDPMTRAKFIALRGLRLPGEGLREHLTKAIDFYQTAISLDPSSLPAYNNLGCALLLQEDSPKANVVLHDALKIAPEAADALDNLGVAAVFAHQAYHARAYFARAYELGSTYDAPLLYLGKLAQAEAHETDARSIGGPICVSTRQAPGPRRSARCRCSRGGKTRLLPPHLLVPSR